MVPASAQLQYREASASDVPAMAGSRVGDSDAGAADPRMEAYLEGRHHPQRARPPRIAYVALDGRAVVGYIAGHLTQRFDCDGEVQYLYVAPRHRRQGIAGKLLRLLASWFVAQGAARVCVDVNPDSAAARPFYARWGATLLNPAGWMVWSDVSEVLGNGTGTSHTQV
jgi:GNAT superfamily N-acetyltransferase